MLQLGVWAGQCKETLAQKGDSEQGYWSKPLLSLVRAGIRRCKDKVFKEKTVFDKFIVEITLMCTSTDYSTVLRALVCSRKTDIVLLCRLVVHNELAKAPSNDVNLGFPSPLREFLELLSVSHLRIYLNSFTGTCTLLITCEKPRNHGPNPARMIKIVRTLSYLNDALH